jgi:hypothetical protein
VATAEGGGDLFVDVVAQLAALRADLRALPCGAKAPDMAAQLLKWLTAAAAEHCAHVQATPVAEEPTALDLCLVAGEAQAAVAFEGSVAERIAAIREDLRWAVRQSADAKCPKVAVDLITRIRFEARALWPHRASFRWPGAVATVTDALVVAGQLSAAAPDSEGHGCDSHQ